MPIEILPRSSIVNHYQAVFPLPLFPRKITSLLESSSSQPTFGVNFEEPAREGETETFTPMLHQTKTAADICHLLPHGINTVILGDPVGAGKTYEAILTYLTLLKSNPSLRMVITVPNVVIADWLKALETLGISSKHCQIWCQNKTTC